MPALRMLHQVGGLGRLQAASVARSKGRDMALILKSKQPHDFRNEHDFACKVCGLKMSQWLVMKVGCPGKGTTGWLSS